MQKNTRATRNVRTNPYIRSGVPSQKTPGGKRPTRSRRLLQRVILFAVVLVVVLAAAYIIISTTGQAGKPVRINAQPMDNMQAFGENLLYYDGSMLNCVAPNGSVKWHYQINAGADFTCTSTMVVAWNGNQVLVINKDGQPIYTDRMESDIRFARVGEMYIAICYGDELTSTIRVLSHAGLELDRYELDLLYVLDMGFFYTRGTLMWVSSLDINGNTPITNLTTYEPTNQMITGAAELQDELVYSIYVHGNNLMVVDTTKIRTYNYKCVEQTDLASIPVYGWQVKQSRAVNRNTYALFEQMPSEGDTPTFSELRLMTNYTVQSLRLLAPCFASGLSEKGVYGFGANIVYYAPYGSTTFKGTPLSYDLTDFVCMLDNGRAVVISGDAVYIMKLPT